MLSKERVFYVYAWYIKDTNEIFYIGKGKGKRYKTVTKRNKFFRDMYNTHNCDVKILLNELTEKEAFELEREFILYIRENTDYRLTNQSDGGEGNAGYHPTIETRKKMSQSLKAIWEEDEFRQKMIALRSDQNSVYKSQEFRDKISKLVCGSKNPNYQNYWTDEQKQHLKDVKKGRFLKSDNPNSKRIICLENGKIFECIEDAAIEYNVKSSSSISVALSEDIRTAAGLHWKYFDNKLLDDKYRKEVLIDVLGRSNNKQSFICLETKEIFITKKELRECLNLSISMFNKYINDNCLKYNNYTYVPIKEYINCPVYK